MELLVFLENRLEFSAVVLLPFGQFFLSLFFHFFAADIVLSVNSARVGASERLPLNYTYLYRVFNYCVASLLFV